MTAAATAGIAPVLLVVLPAGPASAHGYVSAPGSRQAQCARGVVPCGSIKYEPQSVEGPKGLRSCSAGLKQFAELDDDSRPWQASSVNGTVSLTWTFTARHATANYEYFLNGQRIAAFDGGGQQPPPTVAHSINLGGASGRQKLLAVWNIADTPMAFYSCVDLQIGGGGANQPGPQPPAPKPPQPPAPQPPQSSTTQTTAPQPSTSQPIATTKPTSSTQQQAASAAEWKQNTAYAAGAEVTYQGARYRIIQPHTSLWGWEPPATPALWQKL